MTARPGRSQPAKNRAIQAAHRPKPPVRRSWFRSLQRELHQQTSSYPRTLRGLLLLCGLTSAALAGWLWSNQLGLLHKEQLQREETQRGLLDLRITSHKITALDWGQWTPLYRFAGGEDPTFVAREVLSSSIIRDGQLLVIAGADGQLRSLPAGRLPSALKPCLRQRLAVLRRQPDLTGQSRAYGLFCRAGAAAYLGGTTAILPSAGPGRARGFGSRRCCSERTRVNKNIRSEISNPPASLPRLASRRRQTEASRWTARRMARRECPRPRRPSLASVPSTRVPRWNRRGVRWGASSPSASSARSPSSWYHG